MQLKNILVLTAGLFVAVISPLAAQPLADSTQAKPALPVSAVRHTTAPVGPRASAQFQRITPALAPSESSKRSSDVMDDEQHVIVVSTLALVLAVIIIVLVVVN